MPSFFGWSVAYHLKRADAPEFLRLQKRQLVLWYLFFGLILGVLSFAVWLSFADLSLPESFNWWLVPGLGGLVALFFLALGAYLGFSQVLAKEFSDKLSRHQDEEMIAVSELLVGRVYHRLMGILTLLLVLGSFALSFLLKNSYQELSSPTERSATVDLAAAVAPTIEVISPQENQVFSPMDGHIKINFAVAGDYTSVLAATPVDATIFYSENGPTFNWNLPVPAKTGPLPIYFLIKDVAKNTVIGPQVTIQVQASE